MRSDPSELVGSPNLKSRCTFHLGGRAIVNMEVGGSKPKIYVDAKKVEIA